jgi:hypothetical protein
MTSVLGMSVLRLLAVMLQLEWLLDGKKAGTFKVPEISPPKVKEPEDPLTWAAEAGEGTPSQSAPSSAKGNSRLTKRLSHDVDVVFDAHRPLGHPY